jgi:hypothetical protein
MISDAPTGRPRIGPRPSPDSRIPEGVSLNGDNTLTKRFSLYAFYRHHIDCAYQRRDVVQLHLLAGLARRDHLEYIGQHKRRDHGDVERELLRNYAGFPARDAAVLLDESETWAKQRRLVNGFDAEHGEKTRRDPRARGRHRERNEQIIARSQAPGTTTRAIAAEFDISPMQVSRILRGA